ncbi:MAG: ATP-dependent DNA ligase, partial [Proteobacteria bacterium]
MKKFSDLIYALGTSTKTNDKLKALVHYFETADDKDKVWAIALFSGRRPKRSVSSTLLRSWTAEETGIPSWLFDECYHTVGDLSETIALLIGKKSASAKEELPLHYYIEKLDSLKTSDESEKKKFVIKSWKSLADERTIFVFNKLFSATFRIGVSQQLMMRALAKVASMEVPKIAHLIAGKWDPSTITYGELLDRETTSFDISRPYPFFLAYPLETEPDQLGDINDWQLEWKWDGIRGQIIKRSGSLFVWSRGEELITERFPEFMLLNQLLPDGTVLDGEILSAVDGTPLPFSILQKRIGRVNLTKKILQEAPAVFFAYDLLETNGADIRDEPLVYRRFHLKALVDSTSVTALALSAPLAINSWTELAELRTQSRENNAEGFMLKQKNSAYLTGRKRGGWWKWK